MTQEGMVAYKDTKECHNDRMQYTVMIYLVDKNEVQSKVVIYFLGLNLIFINLELEESDDESTPRFEDATSLLGDADPPPLTT